MPLVMLPEEERVRVGKTGVMGSGLRVMVTSIYLVEV